MARIPTFDIPEGDIRNASVDYTATASDFGVNVSSAAWEIQEGNSITLGGSPTLSSNVTTEAITARADYSGCSLIKVQATMSDGQTVSKYIRINVIGPGC
jgi:hypothetical protein